jgi:hypothetical protein
MKAGALPETRNASRLSTWLIPKSGMTQSRYLGHSAFAECIKFFRGLGRQSNNHSDSRFVFRVRRPSSVDSLRAEGTQSRGMTVCCQQTAATSHASYQILADPNELWRRHAGSLHHLSHQEDRPRIERGTTLGGFWSRVTVTADFDGRFSPCLVIGLSAAPKLL